MTLEQLRQVPNLIELSSDLRFVLLMEYLRANPSAREKSVTDANSAVRNEGRFQGWFDCLGKIEEALHPAQKDNKSTPATPAYTK